MSLWVSSLCFILLGLSLQTGSGETSTLGHDLHTILDTVSFEDFASPFLSTYQDSPEFARSAEFLVSSEFDTLVDELVASVYFEEYKNLLMEHGVPAEIYLEKLRAMTHAPPFPARLPVMQEKPGIDKDFMPVIYNMMPYFILTDITDAYFYLSRTSVPFMGLLRFLASDEHQNTLNYLLECSQFQALTTALLENGIDVNRIYNYIAMEIEVAQY